MDTDHYDLPKIRYTIGELDHPMRWCQWKHGLPSTNQGIWPCHESLLSCLWCQRKMRRDSHPPMLHTSLHPIALGCEGWEEEAIAKSPGPIHRHTPNHAYCVSVVTTTSGNSVAATKPNTMGHHLLCTEETLFVFRPTWIQPMAICLDPIAS